MDLIKIRKNANRLALKNAVKLIPIFVFVELILLVLMFISNQIVSILLSLLFSTITHAYVTSSLKAIKDEEISFKVDAFVGIRGYTYLFPSYIMRKLVINVISIVLLIPTLYLIYSKTTFVSSDLLNWIQFIVVSGVEDLYSFSTIYPYMTSLVVIISFVVAVVFATILSFGLSMVPYLVEEQDISWYEAMMKSWRMMTGHKKELFILRLSYLPQTLLVLATIRIVASVLSFSLYLSTFSTLVLSVYLPIILYQAHLEIANALFYKELINKEEHPDLFYLG